MVKILHCADVHLDSPFATLGNDEKRNIRREELKECFQRICNIARQEEVDLLLIAGDLYEHRYIKRSTIDFLVKMFNSLSPMPIFICAGNHDPYVNGSTYKEFLDLPNVFIFGEGKKYDILEKNLVVYGQGFTDFYKDGLKYGCFDDVDENKINIMLTHGSLNIDMGKNKYNPLYVSQLKSLNMDYIALGHFHNRVDDNTREKLIYNPGSPEPLGFDEAGEHGVYIVEINKNGREIKKDIKYMSTNKRSYHVIDVDITGCLSKDEIIIKIETMLKKISKEDNVSINLKGFMEKGLELDISRIGSKLGDYFYILVNNITSLNISFEDALEDRSIKGEFIRKMMCLIKASKDDKERRNLVNALYIGIECLENGNVEIEKYFPLN